MADNINEDRIYEDAINEALESLDGTEKVYTADELMDELYKEFCDDEITDSII